MDIPVWVERVENGFRATGGGPFDLLAEGSTSIEALARLRGMINDRVASGARLVPMSVPAEHPAAAIAGDLKGDPMLEQWIQAMSEYRHERDADPSF